MHSKHTVNGSSTPQDLRDRQQTHLGREREWELRVMMIRVIGWIESLNESNEAINESYKDSIINLRISLGSHPFYIWSCLPLSTILTSGGRCEPYISWPQVWLSWATQCHPLVASEQNSKWAAPSTQIPTFIFLTSFLSSAWSKCGWTGPQEAGCRVGKWLDISIQICHHTNWEEKLLR